MSVKIPLMTWIFNRIWMFEHSIIHSVFNVIQTIAADTSLLKRDKNEKERQKNPENMYNEGKNLRTKFGRIIRCEFTRVIAGENNRRILGT